MLAEGALKELQAEAREAVAVGDHNALDATALDGVQKGTQPRAREVEAGGHARVRDDLRVVRCRLAGGDALHAHFGAGGGRGSRGQGVSVIYHGSLGMGSSGAAVGTQGADGGSGAAAGTQGADGLAGRKRLMCRLG